jgi:hypothetical protein
MSKALTNKTRLNSLPTLVAPNTQTSSAYTVVDADVTIIFNTAATHTLTLPNPANYVGRIINLKNIAAFAINSASSNVVPISTATAGTAILVATAGKYCAIQSDGSNWIVLSAN